MSTTTAYPGSSPGRGRRRGQRRRDLSRHRRPFTTRVRADAGTVRGALWSVVIAIDFFLLSNPVVLVPVFDRSLEWALVATAIGTVLSLPWLRLPRPPLAVLAFLGWAGLSATWSINPGATFDAVGLYVLVATIAVVVAANASIQVIIHGFVMGAVAVVATSLYALQQQLPGAAVPLGTEGYLAGVGSNRNILAYTLTLALPMLLSSIPRRWVPRVFWFAALAAILGGIYASSSGTGIVTCFFLVALAVLLALTEVIRPRWGLTKVRVVYSALFVTLVASVMFFDRVASLLGRDSATLSGRVPLWSASFEVSQQEPLLGYGWGAVWPHPWAPAPDNPVVEEIYASAGVALTHGHNSWLDVLPELGFVGVGLGALIFITAAVKAATLRRSPDDSACVSVIWRLVLLSLAGHLVFGLTEPILTIPLGWFVLALVAAVGYRAEHRLSPGSPQTPG